MRRWGLALASFLASAGLFVTLVLSLSEARGAIPPCGAATGCAAVAESPYSHLAGLPVAYIGAAFYVLALALSFIGTARATSILALLSGAGLFGSVAFVSISLFLVQATCWWCMAS